LAASVKMITFESPPLPSTDFGTLASGGEYR
jgi:hypothetical protein